jgi:hypothetical protein
MSHPWSQMPKEEMDRRRRMLHSVMMISGVFLVGLFAVQLRASFSAEAKQVDNDPLETGARLFDSLRAESVDPLAEIKEVANGVAEFVEGEVVKEKAKSAVFEKISKDIEARVVEGETEVEPEPELDPVEGELIIGEEETQ